MRGVHLPLLESEDGALYNRSQESDLFKVEVGALHPVLFPSVLFRVFL
jgi:hypothetical protein